MGEVPLEKQLEGFRGVGLRNQLFALATSAKSAQELDVLFKSLGEFEEEIVRRLVTLDVTFKEVANLLADYQFENQETLDLLLAKGLELARTADECDIIGKHADEQSKRDWFDDLFRRRLALATTLAELEAVEDSFDLYGHVSLDAELSRRRTLLEQEPLELTEEFGEHQ